MLLDLLRSAAAAQLGLLEAGERLQQKVVELERRLAALDDQIAELEARLARSRRKT